MTMVWEHIVRDYSLPRDDAQKSLMNLGDQGWEVVGMSAVGGFSTKLYVILKRKALARHSRTDDRMEGE